MKYLPRSLQWLPVAVSGLCLLSAAAGCGSDAPPMGDSVRQRDSLPVMVTHAVSKLISDSGVMRYKLIAEEWRVYDKTVPPRWEFPKGIFLERYDDKFKVNLHITADSAWLYDQKVWKLRGHIVLDDEAARTHLTTQELYWNMQSGELSSNVYTHLTEPGQEIEGDWFRATIINKRITKYHVKQSRGFMPMSDMGASPAPAPAATGTNEAANDTVPQRQREVPHPKTTTR